MPLYIGYTGGMPEADLEESILTLAPIIKKIVDDLKQIKKNAVLDGELVTEDKNGKSSFHDIQQYNGDTKDLKLKYYVFDLLSALTGTTCAGWSYYQTESSF